MSISLLRYGFVLILLSLVFSLFIPAMAVPRLALSAHTIGFMSGVIMIVVGGIWSAFALGPLQAALMKWTWIYSGYANWLGCLVGAATGAGQMTPIAASGRSGPILAEVVVSGILISVGLTSLIAAALSIWGLRKRASTALVGARAEV